MDIQAFTTKPTRTRGWFAVSRPCSSELRARLFCFAHAGADGRLFLPWAARLPPTLEVVGVSLPGRGSRICEEPWSSIPQLVQRLSVELDPHGSVPCYFFGHSFGAMLAFALAVTLCEQRPDFPLRGLVLSSCRPPQLGLPHPSFLHELESDAFFDELRKFDGLPEGVVACEKMCGWIERPLRADIRALELWVHGLRGRAPQVPVPIRAVGGRDDPAISAQELGEWRRCTSAEHSVRLMEGGHFHFSENAEPLLEVLRSAVMPALREPCP